MLRYIILFSAVLQSITCEWPQNLQKCPLPDPNANGCLLNSARDAMWYVIYGNPDIGIPNTEIVTFNGDSLILEYNFETNHSTIQLFGEIVPSTDSIFYEASVNLNWQSWNFLMGGLLLTSNLDFILNIYDESSTIQAKGHISLTQENWRLSYNGNYVLKEIDNETYMQISWAYASISDDTFDITYTGITTLDDQPITGPSWIRVKKALRRFEDSFHGKESDIGETIFTQALNAILRLEPYNKIFLPVPNQCPENE